MQVAFSVVLDKEWPGCPGMGRDVPDLEKLYARKLWADFSHPTQNVETQTTTQTKTKNLNRQNSKVL